MTAATAPRNCLPTAQSPTDSGDGGRDAARTAQYGAQDPGCGSAVADRLPAVDIASESSAILSLSVTRLTAVLALERPEPLSHFLGATLRGGFGICLRSLACVSGAPVCSCSCAARRSCAYAFLFESSPADNAPRLRAYRDIPRPFTMRPRQDRERLSVDICLIGRAAGFASLFVRVLNRLGAAGLGTCRVRFRVAGVRNCRGEEIDAAKRWCAAPLPAENIAVYPGQPSQGAVTLRLLSPLAVRKNGAVLDTYDNGAFFATLLRRVTNLCALFGHEPVRTIDPQRFLSPAAQLSVQAHTTPVTMARLSARQGRRIDYDGILGEVRLSGDIGSVMPLLRAGEVLGVGKNTVFGFGAYEMNVFAAAAAGK